MSSVETLFPEITSRIPSSLGPHGWYLITASSLISCGKPEQLSSLYIYATGPNSPLTAAEKSELSQRLQDVLAKAWTLVGIPLVILAAAALAKVEGQDNLDPEGVSTEKWQPPPINPATTARGTSFMQALYRDNLDPIFATLGARAAYFDTLEKTIIYGLFLADHTVLSPVESVLVTLPLIMCQGLRPPTLWHLRGLRRLGVAEEDVERVQSSVEIVARWAGRSTEGWPRVEDVRDEV